MRSLSTLIRRLAGAVLAVEWLVLLLALPLTITIGPSAAAVLVAIPLLALARRLATGHFVPPTPLNGTILALLLIVLFNSLITPSPALTIPPVARTVYGAAVFFGAVSYATRSRRHFAWSMVLYLGAGLAIAALALFATQWPAKLPFLSALVAYLPTSLRTINPNYLAGVLLWFIPPALAVAIALPGWREPLRQHTRPAVATGLIVAAWAAAAVLLAILLLTQSRGGLAGLAAALLAMLLVFLRRRRRLLLLFLVLALIGAILAATLVPTQFWLDLAGITGDASVNDPGTLGLEDRLEIWSRARYVIEDFPFTGVRLGTFERVVPLLYPYHTGGEEKVIPHAHNQLLQAAAEVGVPGLLAYLAVWLVAAALLVATWRKAPSTLPCFLALGFGASLLGFFVHGLAEAFRLATGPVSSSGICWVCSLPCTPCCSPSHPRSPAPHPGEMRRQRPCLTGYLRQNRVFIHMAHRHRNG
jgi:putative inorganic carbon (hco3(-)) transporter